MVKASDSYCLLVSKSPTLGSSTTTVFQVPNVLFLPNLPLIWISALPNRYELLGLNNEYILCVRTDWTLHGER